ncbi:hypothetical protein ACGFXC_04955 [Streptomyces sp. NPDC048507]|uniref:hypothetical protein n=1 Tax=Streptomyces sp. NPDC048507 TaxID=3365560 RepID=UPI0037246152
MDGRGAGTPWHVWEGVPAGREEIPGLLRRLVTPGQAGPAWERLEQKLGWQDTAPHFAPTAARLFTLLPELDVLRRAEVLDFLARRGHGACRSSAGVHRPAFTVFTHGWPPVLPLLTDGAAAVRTGAARLLRAVRCADPQALDALRRQAAVEEDPTALAAHLLAVGRLVRLPGAGYGPGAERWFRPWMEHEDPLVRLAAAKGVLRAGRPAGPAGPDGPPDARRAAGAGRTVAAAFAERGSDALPDVPWWPGGHAVARRFARLLAPHPQEAAALVEALAHHPRAELREAALVTADARLRYWRDPAPRLWDTLAAALDDETLAPAALTAFARSGTRATPYADRLVDYVRRRGDDGRSPYAAHAVMALTGAGDDRAAAWYGARCGDYGLRGEAAAPERWAPALLPGLRELLVAGAGTAGTGTGGRAEALRILARWGPAAAPAVPELTALLDTPVARPAAEALGRIGAAAAPAARSLAALALGDRKPTGHGALPWRGAQTAAWAYWRATGDPEPALRVCGAAVRAGPGRPVLRYLADLGPLAAPYADAVRPLLSAPGEWSRVGAASAWWRITGDAPPALAALLPELAPLAEHHVPPLVLRTVRELGAIGRPAAAALPALRAVTASRRRYGGDVVRDEELCAAARQALRRIDAPLAPDRTGGQVERVARGSRP